MRIQVAGRSDIGRKRDLNEDSFLCAEIGPGPAVLLAVADGIGGHSAGEVASAAAVEILRQAVAERLAESGSAPPAVVLGSAFLKANEGVFHQANGTERLNGMGTTLVAVLVANGKAAAANVGDSRLYCVREGALSQVTRDHSWAAEQVRARLMAAEDVVRSPFRNMVTRSIGYAESLIVDTFELELRPGDALLLASDGLFGSLQEKDILKPFRRKKRPEDICRALVRLAWKAGGRDNITAVVALVAAS